MPDHLHAKFEVRRTDATDLPGCKHEGCEYFVLDLTHDKHAMAALEAYCKSAQEERPGLVADIRFKWIGGDNA